MTKDCVIFIDGCDEYSEGTSDCSSPEYGGCIYQINGRCVFHVATLQQRTSMACYDPMSEPD